MRAEVVAIFIAVGLAGCSFDRIESVFAPPPNAEPLLGCSLDCHGDDNSSAPPRGASGATATTERAVGAHRVHLTAEPEWHAPIACADCHVVPETVDAPGHIDGDGVAEVTFSMKAGEGAKWNGTTCLTGCNGGSSVGGAQPLPEWTLVDGTQSTCGSCHSTPPPAPHPVNNNCATCHPTMEEGSMTFRDPASHINGIEDYVPPGATGGCTTCHGTDSVSSAPPRDLAGNAAATVPGVGAHARHLAPSTWHRGIACSSCHRVPTTQDSPGHRDGDDVAEVIFSGLNPAATYTKASSSCASLYCHGNGRGNTGTASWVTPGALACNACHSTDGTGQSGQHRVHIVANVQCVACHSAVVNANLTVITASLHINGAHEVKMASGTYDAAQKRCQNTACHNSTRYWN